MENGGPSRSKKLLYTLVILLAWLVYAAPLGYQVVSAQAAEGAVHVVEVRGVIKYRLAEHAADPQYKRS